MFVYYERFGVADIRSVAELNYGAFISAWWCSILGPTSFSPIRRTQRWRYALNLWPYRDFTQHLRLTGEIPVGWHRQWNTQLHPQHAPKLYSHNILHINILSSTVTATAPESYSISLITQPPNYLWNSWTRCPYFHSSLICQSVWRHNENVFTEILTHVYVWRRITYTIQISVHVLVFWSFAKITSAATVFYYAAGKKRGGSPVSVSTTSVHVALNQTDTSHISSQLRCVMLHF